MRTGIPAYRLPRESLDRDIDRILSLGVQPVLDSRIDHERLVELTREFDAVLAATGLQRLTALDLGDSDERVMQGIEFLDRARQGRVRVDGETVLVIGGGNTAVDAARSAFRLGAREVRILYRRSREEMPAIPEEVDDAVDEGVQIDFLCAPQRVSRDNGQAVLRCQRMTLGEADESGRRRPVAVPGSDFAVPFDRVVLALGQAPDLSLLPPEARFEAQKPLIEEGGTPVYPAGDLLTNEGTVTAAIGCGREMALRLHERFSGERLYEDRPDQDDVVRAEHIRLQHFEHLPSHGERVISLEHRRQGFEEVRQGLDGIEEARRCLSCGVCNDCDRCVTYCPDGVLRREGGELVFDYDYCKGCGVCVTECSRAVIYMKAG